MDNMELRFSQLRTSIEELEKRIKAISCQVTVGTQINATKACLEEIKDLILKFEASYNEHLNYCYLSESEHLKEFSDFKIFVNTINTSLKDALKKLETVSNDVEKLKQDSGNLTEISTTLNGVKTNLENVSKQTEQLNKDVLDNKTNITNLLSFKETANTNLGTLNDFKEAMLSSFSSLQSDHNAVKQSFSESLSAISTRQNQFDTTLSSNSQNIGVLTQKVKTLEEGGSGGASTDIKVFDIYKEQSCQASISGKITLPYFFVYAKSKQMAMFKIKLTGNVENINPIKITLNLNDKTYQEEMNVCNLNFEQDVFVNANLNIGTNLLKIDITSPSKVCLERTQVFVSGVNVDIYAQNNLFSVCCFDNKYFVMFKDKNKNIKYGVFNSDVVNFDKQTLQTVDLNNFNNNLIFPCIFPKLTDGAKLAYDGGVLSYALAYICPDDGFNLKTAKLDGALNPAIYNQSVLPNVVCYDLYCTGYDCGGYSVCVIDTNKKAYLIQTMEASDNTVDKLLYQGSEFVDAVNVSIVKNNNNKINKYALQYNGCIITHENGKNYFYPEFDSTYRIELIEGKNITAFAQRGNIVNIYINKDNDVHKFVLELDENYEYKITKQNIIKNCTKVEEGFLNNLIIYHDNNIEIKNSSSVLI